MVGWDVSYVYWTWDLAGDPMAPGIDLMREYGAQGWELVAVTSTPHTSYMQYKNVHLPQPSFTSKVYFQAAFKRPVAAGPPPASLPQGVPPPPA